MDEARISTAEFNGKYSASQFVNSAAEELQNWLRETRIDPAFQLRRWTLRMLANGGIPIEVLKIAAIGPNSVKVAGIDLDGEPCMILAHHNSIQLVASYLPLDQGVPPPRREIGFHTGLKGSDPITFQQ